MAISRRETYKQAEESKSMGHPDKRKNRKKKRQKGMWELGRGTRRQGKFCEGKRKEGDHVG